MQWVAFAGIPRRFLREFLLGSGRWLLWKIILSDISQFKASATDAVYSTTRLKLKISSLQWDSPSPSGPNDGRFWPFFMSSKTHNLPCGTGFDRNAHVFDIILFLKRPVYRFNYDIFGLFVWFSQICEKRNNARSIWNIVDFCYKYWHSRFNRICLKDLYLWNYSVTWDFCLEFWLTLTCNSLIAFI